MGGFMPLIEAFLAFALTMLALATAVSAVVGVWLRLFRWRAFGLRQSMEAIYDNQIEPRLAEAQRRNPTLEDRQGFIADMTFALNAQAGTVHLDVRKRRVRELEYCVLLPASARWYARSWRFLMRRLRGWRSLRFGVDYLSENQFQFHLDASQAGSVLAAYYGAEEWQRLKIHLAQSFTEVGVLASEGFARRARTRTIIAGLVLALAVNIDSFDLLNTYLTDHEIRRNVIAQQEEIIKQQVPAQADSQTVSLSLGGYSEKVDTTIEQIQNSISEIGTAQNLSANDKQNLEQLQKAFETVRGDVAIVTEATEELEDAISKTSGIATSLTKSFPIGWDGYPNCGAAMGDLRCTRLKIGLGITFLDASGLREAVIKVAKADTSGFIKWLIGVLLTGFMVGLGAPFWVRTVDRLLEVKKQVTGTNSNESVQESESAPGHTESPAVGPPARIVPGGRGGQVARIAADQAAVPTTAPPAASVAGNRARQAADEAVTTASRKG